MDPKQLKERFEPKQAKVIEAEPWCSGHGSRRAASTVAGTFDGRVCWNVAEDSLPA
jgi:hypothetical protein